MGRGVARTVSGRSTTGGDARRSVPRVVWAVAITVLSSVLCWARWRPCRVMVLWMRGVPLW